MSFTQTARTKLRSAAYESRDIAAIFLKNPIGALLVIGFSAVGIYLAAPVSVYVLLTLLGLWIARLLPEGSAWRKAVYSVLVPASVGFALLLVALFLMWTLLVHTQYLALDYALTYKHLNWIDFQLLTIHSRLDSLQHLAFLQTAFLVLLIFLARTSTRLPLVTWALKLKRWLAFAISAAALMTSFSFIATDAVTGGLANELVDNIKIMYGINMSAAQVDIAQGLSALAVSKAISSSGPNSIAAVFHLSELGERFGRDHVSAGRDDIFDSLNDCYVGFSWISKQTVPATTARQPSHVDPSAEADPAEALRVSEETAATASSIREKQEEAAIKEVLRALAGVVPKKVSDFGLDWLGHLIGTEYSVFSELAKELAEEVRDNEFEKRIDPAIESASTSLRSHLDRRWGRLTELPSLDSIVERHTARYVEAGAKLREQERREYAEALKMIGISEDGKLGDHRVEVRGMR